MLQICADALEMDEKEKRRGEAIAVLAAMDAPTRKKRRRESEAPSTYVLNNQAQDDGRVFHARSRRGTLVCNQRCSFALCYCSVNEHKALGQKK